MTYFIDDGYVSLNHVNEELCGDKVEIVRNELGTTIVLADGLGSGVKANILATLTSKLLGLMIANGANIEECVSSVIATLPVCSVRKVAYATFTVVHIDKNGLGYVFEFDNPPLIYIRNKKRIMLDRIKKNIIGKDVYYSTIQAQKNDFMIFCSDGAPHAGIGKTMNLGWSIDDIGQYILDNYNVNMSAREVAALVGESCNALYMGEPGDDTTIAAIKICEPVIVNLLVGPPMDKQEDNIVASNFMSKEGIKIVCGGTTSKIIAKYLKKEVKTTLNYFTPEVPPIGMIDGIDLVTEGVITLGKTLDISKKYVDIKDVDSKSLSDKDGASLIANFLLKKASHVNLFVGTSINAAHKDLPIDIAMKLKIVENIKSILESCGKIVTIEYH